ncbi:MAG: hypothetical protein ACKVU2_17810 [Saprospiraceae bacterium]
MNYENYEAYDLQPEFEYGSEQEMHETELAYELLNVQNEAELDYFLGKLFKRAWSGAKKLYHSPMGQAIKGQVVSGLKSMGRRALPKLGAKIGGYIGGQTGANWGAKAGSWAADRYLNEYDGEMHDELTLARNLIRTAQQTAGRIARQAHSGRPLNRGMVHGILSQTARQHFPGLLWAARGASNMMRETDEPTTSPMADQPQSSGTWYRQGNQLVLTGV